MIRRGLVLDIETAPDRTAVTAAGRTPRTASVWLHRIVAVSLLSFAEQAAPIGFDDFALATILALPDGHRGHGDLLADADAMEATLLDAVERAFGDLGETGQLITFNGAQHDLPMLQIARWRHGLFSKSRMAPWQHQAADQHHDVMERLCTTGLRRWPALVDACAAFAIPCDPTLQPEQGALLNPAIRKSQTDVAATFLLYLMVEAGRHGSAAVVDRGWTALATHLLRTAPTLPHLTQFAFAPRARRAIRAGAAGSLQPGTD